MSAEQNLHWTKTKPLKDGWYWFRAAKYKHNSICEVRNGIVRWAFGLHDKSLSELKGEWWGPLAEPDLSPDGTTYDCKDVNLTSAADDIVMRLSSLFEEKEKEKGVLPSS